MKGIIIISCGNLAEGMIDTVKHFFGYQPQLKAVCMANNESIEVFQKKIKEGISEVDDGDGVLVFCDMMSGTPYNCVKNIITNNSDSSCISVITGFNLSMLMQALSSRECSGIEINDLINVGKNDIFEF